MFMPRPPVTTLPSHDPLFLLRRAEMPLRKIASGIAGQQIMHTDVEFSVSIDPAAQFDAKWQSPKGRILELEFAPSPPLRWLGLHLPIDPDLSGFQWYGFALRHSASRPIGFRAAMRTDGAADADFFFPRHLMIGPEQGDHCDLIDPRQIPDLPLRAGFRELILFLPVTVAYAYALHDLRLVRL